MRRAAMIRFALGLGVVVASAPARAWDAATTHAGLTEHAVLASSLVRRIGPLFGLPSGLFETLRFEASDTRRQHLRDRLGRLDPTAGVAPDGGRLPALSWLVAGSVVEEAPAERRRNHFFDPTTGRGLHQGGPLGGLGFGVASIGSGAGSVRDLFAGEAFDGTGLASTAWLTSPANDLGLPYFLEARERAVTAASPEVREVALAEALLVAGALLHVVEDAAVPAYVHNDFKTDLYDLGGPLLAFAAVRYGRLAVPRIPDGGPVTVAHLGELIHAADGSGLADRTARRFYSLGLLADDDQASRPEQLPSPVAGAGARGYFTDAAHRHLARFVRDSHGHPRWDLDARCYLDYANTLLPEAGRAALSALEHLFRDPLVLDDAQVRNGPVALASGIVTVLVEDDGGTRRVALRREARRIAADAPLVELPPTAVGRHVAVIFRGVDARDEPIVTSVESAAHTAMGDGK